MPRSGYRKCRSIRVKFFGIQLASILMTVTLVTGISLSLLHEFNTDSQRSTLEAHAQALAIEADQQLKQLKDRLWRLETFEYHRYQRVPVLAKVFVEQQDVFPRLSYFEESGQQDLKVLDGRVLQGSLKPLKERLLQQVLERPNRVLVTVEPYDIDFSGPSIVLTMAKVGYFGDEFKGVLQASVPLALFNSFFHRRELEHGAEVYLVDELGRFLLHPDQGAFLQHIVAPDSDWRRQLLGGTSEHHRFGHQLIGGKEFYYSFRMLTNEGWYAFAVAPVSIFNYLLNDLVRANLFLGLFGVLFGLLLAHLMVRPILQNIGLISKQTQNLADGKLDERIEMAACDELQVLADAVNTLTDKLQYASAAYDSVDLMLQTVIDPLIICGSDGVIFKTNGAAQELFATTSIEFAGKNLNRFFSHRSPLVAQDLLSEFLQQPHLKNYETEIVGSDGEQIPVNFSFAHAYSEAGEDQFVVCLFKDISLQKSAEQEISKLAYYDSLTSLPNRSLLHDRLEMLIRQMQRSKSEYTKFAVLFLDLDHFKMVNDTFGHSVGDKLLQSAAQRLKGCLREADTVSRIGDDVQLGEKHVLARLGGDEFIILLPHLRVAEDAAIVARQIIADMAKPFLIDGNEVVTPASIGLAIYPDDGEDRETLLRCADIAMYHAKEQGRNSFYFFSAEMNESTRERLNIERQLRQDLERQQGFYLVFQPKVDLQNNRVVGMEALVRWRNEELGEVLPTRFIPIAESSGLIVPLGQWILQAACSQLKQWQESTGAQFKVAVNLSGRQLTQPDLLPVVASVLQDTGLEGESLELELTESMLMETVEKTVVLLSQLKQLGISLAIDDFGTGYSSLSYLKRFPIDTLKIDRSFVRDLEADRDDEAIIEAIIAMAGSLKMQVVAEGVETELQFDFLRSRGADLYQGFLFSEPVPASEFARRFLA
ncbi:PAS domain S-box-containing protein/diguanylate cyclase (GGDEF) domain-containing protein [Malonomonas rubra DSM 5091]|uniref:PAS domain S-box-containing protein/diguanylate cyclase (GGDEF) domain-containing protein n=1 Tax=Malonomonas rubra DSM 5091 TaxID=1122189 RepID=A0A1M6ICC2_MALRU|nr:EAL domain-containing protein [Malonomonas rubra]SHJ32101.1 PAS domain S-box-containing protein/diguanylate cyclase (GGDEF) domain-containing protein [Malonomonas rubra DSM 5091]